MSFVLLDSLRLPCIPPSCALFSPGSFATAGKANATARLWPQQTPTKLVMNVGVRSNNSWTLCKRLGKGGNSKLNEERFCELGAAPRPLYARVRETDVMPDASAHDSLSNNSDRCHACDIQLSKSPCIQFLYLDTPCSCEFSSHSSVSLLSVSRPVAAAAVR